MYYEKRFLHRLYEDFLIVGLHDYEELQQAGPLKNEHIELSMDALRCLKFFPSIKHLILTPGKITVEELCTLNGLSVKSLKLNYYSYEVDHHTLDLTYFPQLELIFARTQYCFKNISKCTKLQTLIVQEWFDDSLVSLSGSSIKALKLFSGKLKSLDGIEKISRLVSLSIANQRQLDNCLRLSMTSLESLEIVSCNKVDISQIPVLSDIRMMHLSGKKIIPNVETILQLAPKLEWLLLDHVIANGELSPLKKLFHAVIVTDCRHYSLRNCDLPKAEGRYQSNFLSMDLEILPEAY